MSFDVLGALDLISGNSFELPFETLQFAYHPLSSSLPLTASKDTLGSYIIFLS